MTIPTDLRIHRSGLPITIEKRREAEQRRQTSARYRAERAQAKAMKAAERKPAGELRHVPVLELAAAFAHYEQLIAAQESERDRERLRDLIHRVLGGDGAAAVALRKIVMVHAAQHREAGRSPPDGWWGRSRRGWGDGSAVW